VLTLILGVLSGLAALVAILDFFGFRPRKPMLASPMSPGRVWKFVVMLVVIASSLALSGIAFYRSLRPKIVEKIVEKPVVKVVEKAVQVPCPEKPREAKQGKSSSPKPPVMVSGVNNPPIGTVTQGAASAFSNNQQGGITAGTVNIGTPLLPTPTVKVCVTYPEVAIGEPYKAVVTFTTGSELPRPWFGLFFDGPVLKGVAEMRGAYGFDYERAEKLPEPEKSFLLRLQTINFATSSWFPNDGAIRATIPSKSPVRLVKVMAGGGNDPDKVFAVNLVFSCD
jgi:hypothetical protein